MDRRRLLTLVFGLALGGLCVAAFPQAASEAAGNGTEPAGGAEEVTPHDTNELTYVSRALYVGGAGNIAVVMAKGDEVTFTGVAAGSVLPIRVKQVKNTDTTATGIVSLY